MLIHLAARLLNKNPALTPVELTLTIEKIGFTASTTNELRLGHPYPNQHYTVAQRNSGENDYDGILLDVPVVPEQFTMIALWTFRDDRTGQLKQSTHRVNYTVKDRDFNAYTDDPTHWNPSGCGRFSDRWGAQTKHAPMVLRPVMDTATQPLRRAELGLCDDIFTDDWLAERTEHFQLPSVDPARLFSEHEKRTPPKYDIFLIDPNSSDRNITL